MENSFQVRILGSGSVTMPTQYPGAFNKVFLKCKLERIVEPGEKPWFHKTAVSYVTQFHCVERKFSKLLGFGNGIAVSRN